MISVTKCLTCGHDLPSHGASACCVEGCECVFEGILPPTETFTVFDTSDVEDGTEALLASYRVKK